MLHTCKSSRAEHACANEAMVFEMLQSAVCDDGLTNHSKRFVSQFKKTKNKRLCLTVLSSPAPRHWLFFESWKFQVSTRQSFITCKPASQMLPQLTAQRTHMNPCTPKRTCKISSLAAFSRSPWRPVLVKKPHATRARNCKPTEAASQGQAPATRRLPINSVAAKAPTARRARLLFGSSSSRPTWPSASLPTARGWDSLAMEGSCAPGASPVRGVGLVLYPETSWERKGWGTGEVSGPLQVSPRRGTLAKRGAPAFSSARVRFFCIGRPAVQPSWKQISRVIGERIIF